MRPDLALTAIDAVRADHLHGHTCTDGKWWNPHTGSRTPCPVSLHLNTAYTQVQALAAQIHLAAHTPRHVDAVAAALVATPLAELSADNQEAWRGLARQGIEALAWSLENNDQLTQRAQALAARLGNPRTENPCPYTHAHTRHWCGYATCREA